MSEEAEAGARAGARGETRTTEPTRLERASARGVAESKATVPHLYASAEAEMSAWRDDLARDALPRDAVVWAAARALRQHPRLNAAYRDGRFEEYTRVNVGLAVPADAAFAVATIFDADTKTVAGIAAETAALAARVSDGVVTQPELSGGTFTVFAPRGEIDSLTPSVYRGQAAALAAGRLAERPVARNGALVAAPTLRLTLACDGRIISPDQAAAFLGSVGELLRSPEASG